VPLDVWINRIFPFVGPQQYCFVGGACKLFQQMYSATFPEKTTVYNVTSIQHAMVCFNDIPKSKQLKFVNYECIWATWYKKLCYEAIRTRDLKVLKLALKIGCPWQPDHLSQAALNGDFEDLMWARENGCPWDDQTFASQQPKVA
jgi:hypothetical protein